MPSDDPRPLILCLALDPATQSRLNQARELHFPPERNFLAAHLTLFHHLPAARALAVESAIRAIASAQAPIELHATGYRFLGRGVALEFQAPALLSVHRAIAQEFEADLTPQDRQKPKPHVTIQNKVDPSIAKALFAECQQSFVPFVAQGIGLQLWRYDGGPWAEMKTFSFAGGFAGCGTGEEASI